MTDTTEEDDRGVRVVKAILEHIDYARRLAHDLINSYPNAPITALASEQAAEMELRHAVLDVNLLAGYLPKDGGAVG